MRVATRIAKRPFRWRFYVSPAPAPPAGILRGISGDNPRQPTSGFIEETEGWRQLPTTPGYYRPSAIRQPRGVLSQSVFPPRT